MKYLSCDYGPFRLNLVVNPAIGGTLPVELSGSTKYLSSDYDPLELNLVVNPAQGGTLPVELSGSRRIIDCFYHFSSRMSIISYDFL